MPPTPVMSPMAVPVVFETASGPYEAPRHAVEWLWEILDANALPATHAALDKGLDGENVTLPDGERAQLCAQLQELLGRLDQAELSTAITDLRSRLCGP